MSQEELPWYWCAVHDEDLASCPCGDRPLLGRRGPFGQPAEASWVRSPGPRRTRPVDTVETGGLT